MKKLALPSRQKRTPSGSRLDRWTSAPLQLSNADGQTILDLSSEAAAHYRQWYIRLGRADPLPRCLGLASALTDEGVPRVGLELGTVLASDLENKFCVLELDWWQPSLAALTKCEPVPGLAQVLLNEASLDEALRPTSLENLWFLPAGEITGQIHSRLAHSQALQTALDSLSHRFDYLILELPALLAVSDAGVLAAQAECICLVVRQGVTPLPLVRHALDEIAHLSVKGVVLNGDQVSTPDWLLRMLSGNWMP